MVLDLDLGLDEKTKGVPKMVGSLSSFPVGDEISEMLRLEGLCLLYLKGE